MAGTPSLRGTTGAVQDRMVGRTLGARYRVLSRLGEGGMGTVYLCEHAVLGRRYAVKVLRPELCRDAELGERFRNEAIAASRIGGDNVVDVLDFGSEDDGALYYVMEALDGRSLGVILAEEGPLAVPRTLDLLDQVCRALGAAHARGVIHRDIKPDNVFVVRRPDGSEQAKVIDFGISQVTPPVGQDRLTLAGSIIGTPEYMAPEQAAGEPIDERADVYALGVLAYELLTGTLPIVALTPVATLVAHQTHAPIPPSRRRAGIPPEVDALLMRALAKRPSDRPRNMGEFSAAIGAIRGTAPVTPSGAPRVDSPAPGSVPGPETVALPGLARTFTPRRWRAGPLAVIMVVVGGMTLAAGAAWWWAARAPSAGAVGTAPAPTTAGAGAGAAEKVSSTPTSTPGSTSTSGSAGAADSAPGAPAKPARRQAKPSSAAAPRRTAPEGAGTLKDPYR